MVVSDDCPKGRHFGRHGHVALGSWAAAQGCLRGNNRRLPGTDMLVCLRQRHPKTAWAVRLPSSRPAYHLRSFARRKGGCCCHCCRCCHCLCVGFLNPTGAPGKSRGVTRQGRRQTRTLTGTGQVACAPAPAAMWGSTAARSLAVAAWQGPEMAPAAASLPPLFRSVCDVTPDSAPDKMVGSAEPYQSACV